MRKSEKSSAVQFSGNKVIAVELVHGEDEFELTSSVEEESQENFSELFSYSSGIDPQKAYALADAITAIRQAGDIEAPIISFCLDSRWVLTHSFPIDESLSDSERSDFIQWELSNYLTPLKYKDYVTATARLEELPTPATSLVLSASAKRDLISLFRRTTSILGLHLAVIDVDHFGAEHALRWNYPEIQHETVGLFGLKPSRIDASLIVRGNPIRFRSLENLDGKVTPSFLQEFFSQSSNGKPSCKRLFMYGDKGDTSDLSMFSIGDSFSVELLDPLRQVNLSRRLRRMEFSNFHRYAPAIGIAMRKG